jgi:hypothetical protein
MVITAKKFQIRSSGVQLKTARRPKTSAICHRKSLDSAG